MSDTTKKPVSLALIPEFVLAMGELRRTYVVQNRFALEPAPQEDILRSEELERNVYEVETETAVYIAFECNWRNKDRFYWAKFFIAMLPELPGGQNPIDYVIPGQRLILERVDPLNGVLTIEKVITEPVKRVYNVLGDKECGVCCIETEDAHYYVQNI